MSPSTLENQDIKIKLFEGEVFKSEEANNDESTENQSNLDNNSSTEDQDPDHLTDDEIEQINQKINEKYIKGEVRIVTEQARYPLNTVAGMIKSGKYDLKPDFQRRRRWDDQRKSRLIESFIINIPVPPIFLYEVGFAKFEVIDGQQRMSTIDDFYQGKFALEGLEKWPELNGRTYNTLPEYVKAGIDRRYLSSIILFKETAKTQEQENILKRLVFQRLNSGGIKIEPQEIRNALYDGPLNQLCIKLSENATFRKLWNINVNEGESLTNQEREKISEMYKTMYDVELVLRFFTFRHINSLKSIPLNEMLDNFLRQGNKFDDSVLKQYEKLFNQTIDLVAKLFEENAFRLWTTGRKGSRKENQWDWSNKPLNFVYDTVMIVFSQYVEQTDQLIAQKEVILEKIKEFYEQDNGELFEGRKTTRNHVSDRIRLMMNFVEQFV